MNYASLGDIPADNWLMPSCANGSVDSWKGASATAMFGMVGGDTELKTLKFIDERLRSCCWLDDEAHPKLPKSNLPVFVMIRRSFHLFDLMFHRWLNVKHLLTLSLKSFTLVKNTIERVGHCIPV